MSTKPIEDNWIEIERTTPFCCDQHRDAFRAMYFSGAMAAMNALTGWDPATPGVFRVDVTGIAVVSRELTAVYQNSEMEAAAQAAGSVRH